MPQMPWDLSRTPNYADALPLASVEASALDQRRFYRDFVLRNRPCLIKGALSHWPACRAWSDVDYLKQHTRNEAVRARTAPLREYRADGETHQQFHDGYEAISETLPFHQFLDRVAGDPGQFVLHAIPVVPGNLLERLLSDIAPFDFVRRPGQTRMYPPHRAFFYRNSYTDWHYHPEGEALMCQVTGEKEVVLLAPDEQSWNALVPAARASGCLYGVDLERFPQVGQLRPYRVRVEAGDALYIPVFWWHAVGSVDDKFGVTVACTFGTPLHINSDMRYPAARQLIAGMLRTRLFPLAAGAAAYGYLRRALAAFGVWR
jgi:hypothetical protein